MVDLKVLRRAFQQLYSKAPRIFSAPGRVNLIGEHTDYNEGFVLPIAINRRTFVAAAPRDDRLMRVHSLEIQDEGSFKLDDSQSSTSKRWLAYVAGVAWELEQRGFRLRGSDLVIASDVPIGAGLSSSAALEISFGQSYLAFSGMQVDLKTLAIVAQTAEHKYAGTKCGIMDQLTVALAQSGHALLIDCRSLEVTHIELDLPGTSVVVCNTNVKHELAASAYNQRRAECERSVQILKKRLPTIRSLRDVSVVDFENCADELPELLRRRCRHIVTENERTLEAAKALQEGNLEKLGKLMLRSHQSLRDDYEVSCPELDVMVELALKQNGVFGARMTGGGFGGCTVNLVQKDRLESFTSSISEDYRKVTNIEPAIYTVEADRGVNEIES